MRVCGGALGGSGEVTWYRGVTGREELEEARVKEEELEIEVVRGKVCAWAPRPSEGITGVNKRDWRDASWCRTHIVWAVQC